MLQRVPSNISNTIEDRYPHEIPHATRLLISFQSLFGLNPIYWTRGHRPGRKMDEIPLILIRLILIASHRRWIRSPIFRNLWKQNLPCVYSANQLVFQPISEENVSR